MRKSRKKDPTAPYVNVKTPFTKAEYLLKKARADIKKLYAVAEELKIDTASLDRANAELDAFADSVSEKEE